jgi:GNAT superfamily N-acetyltransferase
MRVRIPLQVQLEAPEASLQAALRARLGAATLPIPAVLEVDVPSDLAARLGQERVWGTVRLTLLARHPEGPPIPVVRLRLRGESEGVGRFELWLRAPDQVKPSMEPFLAETRRVPFSVASSLERPYRGRGLGTAIYAALATWVTPVNGMIVPEVWAGGTTSTAAMGVWSKLTTRPGLRCAQTPFGFVVGCWVVEA